MSGAIALLDIEGTIADARFVHDVLFPYARSALPDFVHRHAAEPAVRVELEAAAEAAELDPSDLDGVVAQLQRWIDEDVKATPLKTLQGMIWRDGYERGAFTAHLFEDARDWMARAREAGVRLYVYSSGSVDAQRLYFGHTVFGNLEDWIDGHFDTRTGPKKAPDSYAAIANRIGVAPSAITFYSDVLGELDAAADAGLSTFHLRRDEQPASDRHPDAESFDALPLPDADQQEDRA